MHEDTTSEKTIPGLILYSKFSLSVVTNIPHLSFVNISILFRNKGICAISVNKGPFEMVAVGIVDLPLTVLLAS